MALTNSLCFALLLSAIVAYDDVIAVKCRRYCIQYCANPMCIVVWRVHKCHVTTNNTHIVDIRIMIINMSSSSKELLCFADITIMTSIIEFLMFEIVWGCISAHHISSVSSSVTMLQWIKILNILESSSTDPDKWNYQSLTAHSAYTLTDNARTRVITSSKFSRKHD